MLWFDCGHSCDCMHQIQYFTAILHSSTQGLQMQLERGCETAVGGSLSVC